MNYIDIFNNRIFGFKNKIILKTDNNYANCKIVFSPLSMQYTTKMDVKGLREKVRIFLEVLNRDCKNFNPNIFFNNFIKTQFDIRNVSEKFYSGITGSVIIGQKKNTFFIKNFDASYHELLHLSSLVDDKQFKPFNEGYTQLLTERYFNTNVGKTYPFQVCIMKTIESILGKDYLEKEYFLGNLTQAIQNKLYEYESKENIVKLFKLNEDLYSLDKDITSIENDDLELNRYCSNIGELLSKIYDILFSCLKNKIEKIDSLDEKLAEFDNTFLLVCFSTNSSESIKVMDRKKLDEYKNSLYEEFNKKVLNNVRK